MTRGVKVGSSNLPKLIRLLVRRARQPDRRSHVAERFVSFWTGLRLASQRRGAGQFIDQCPNGTYCYWTFSPTSASSPSKYRRLPT